MIVSCGIFITNYPCKGWGNGGHLEHVNNNVASSFLEKINGGYVLASDGSIGSGSSKLT